MAWARSNASTPMVTAVISVPIAKSSLVINAAPLILRQNVYRIICRR